MSYAALAKQYSTSSSDSPQNIKTRLASDLCENCCAERSIRLSVSEEMLNERQYGEIVAVEHFPPDIAST